jgi:hypothetical protein
MPVSVSACWFSRLQSSKLQALYTQTQAALEESDGRVTQLTAELSTAQQEAERLRTDMRNLQVGRGHNVGRRVCGVLRIISACGVGVWVYEHCCTAVLTHVGWRKCV